MLKKEMFKAKQDELIRPNDDDQGHISETKLVSHVIHNLVILNLILYSVLVLQCNRMKKNG